jgi:hypothetical protein
MRRGVVGWKTRPRTTNRLIRGIWSKEVCSSLLIGDGGVLWRWAISLGCRLQDPGSQFSNSTLEL